MDMDAQEEQKTTRGEIIFVVALLLIGAGAWVAVLLHQSGTWFQPQTARIIYCVLWAIAWLPGMAMSTALFLRHRKLSLALSFMLQSVALVLYWISVEWLGLAGALGFFGLGLPVFLSAFAESAFKKKCSYLLLFLAPILLAYFADDSWPVLVLVLLPLWALYAGSIWPGIAKALETVHQQIEEQQKRESRFLRWTERITVIVFFFLVVIALSMAGYFIFFPYWQRH
jgi:hypothetical protein